jgi:glucokinase
MSWSVGIDVGGTNVKTVAVAVDGAVLHRITRATSDGNATTADWVGHTRAALAEFGRLLGGEPRSMGLCAPGLVGSDRRSIAHLPGKLPGLAGLDWTEALGASAIVPVLNDAHAALLGEAWIGAARDRQHVVMLTLGTGVGGAVISDGRLLRGAIGRAGHIGHMSLDPEGPVSIVGMPGAIEMMVGDCTVAARTAGRFSTTAALVAAHRAGDVDATRAWQRSIRALACAIGSCINLFDPELVVLGGGIALAGDDLFPLLATELDRVEWRPGGHRVPVVPAMLGEWAGAIGAARNSFS